MSGGEKDGPPRMPHPPDGNWCKVQGLRYILRQPTNDVCTIASYLKMQLLHSYSPSRSPVVYFATLPHISFSCQLAVNRFVLNPAGKELGGRMALQPAGPAGLLGRLSTTFKQHFSCLEFLAGVLFAAQAIESVSQGRRERERTLAGQCRKSARSS